MPGNLQRKQFDLYTEDHDSTIVGVDEDDDIPEYRYATYTLADKRGEFDSDYVKQHGKIEVSHHSSSPYNVETWNDPREWNRPEQPPAHGTPYGTAGGTHTGQQKLLQEKYPTDSPGKSVVDGMYFTKEARAMALPTLAVAARDTAERYGRTLTPSGDRSAHSERLVGHLAEAGAIEPHERAVENQIGFAPASSRPYQRLGDRRPDEVLQQGKRDARSIVRGMRRTRKPPEQGTLF